jgi:hypothetical protein
MPVFIRMPPKRIKSSLSYSFSLSYGAGMINYSSLPLINHNMIRIRKRAGWKKKRRSPAFAFPPSFPSGITL